MIGKQFYSKRRTQTLHLLVSHKTHRLLFIHLQDIDVPKSNDGKGTGQCEWIFLVTEHVRKQDSDKDISYYNNNLGRKYLKYLADLNTNGDV